MYLYNTVCRCICVCVCVSTNWWDSNLSVTPKDGQMDRTHPSVCEEEESTDTCRHLLFYTPPSLFFSVRIIQFSFWSFASVAVTGQTLVVSCKQTRNISKDQVWCSHCRSLFKIYMWTIQTDGMERVFKVFFLLLAGALWTLEAQESLSFLLINESDDEVHSWLQITITKDKLTTVVTAIWPENSLEADQSRTSDFWSLLI